MRTRRLGTVESAAVGTEQTGVVLSEGERVQILRDSASPNSATAIRVVAAGDRTAGFLPRRVTRWLAVLMDRGWVTVKGTVTGEPKHLSVPVELTIRLTPKGAHILEVPAEDPTPAEALHGRVLEHWPPRRNAAREALERIRGKAGTGAAGPVLPETRLLLEIAHSKQRGAAKRTTKRVAAEPVRAARRIVESARVGEPLTSGNLALFPVHMSPEAAPDIIPFDEAHAQGHVIITEVDRDGTVNELIVVNEGPSAVLLPQGLVLVGGKQDRMVAVPVLILSGQRRRVAVNCVEAGRWGWESGGMVPRRVATSSMRRRVSSVPEGTVAQHQSDVWGEVRRMKRAYRLSSVTDAMDELYEQVDLADVPELLDGIPDDASGLVATTGPRLLGCDLFGAPELMAPMAPRLVESWAVEAGMQGRVEGEAPGSEELADLLIDAASRATPSGENAGDGATRLLVKTRRLQGTILLRGETLLHMSLFPAN